MPADNQLGFQGLGQQPNAMDMLSFFMNTFGQQQQPPSMPQAQQTQQGDEGKAGIGSLIETVLPLAGEILLSLF